MNWAFSLQLAYYAVFVSTYWLRSTKAWWTRLKTTWVLAVNALPMWELRKHSSRLRASPKEIPSKQSPLPNITKFNMFGAWRRHKMLMQDTSNLNLSSQVTGLRYNSALATTGKAAPKHKIAICNVTLPVPAPHTTWNLFNFGLLDYLRNAALRQMAIVWISRTTYNASTTAFGIVSVPAPSSFFACS